MSTEADQWHIIAWLQKAKNEGWSDPEFIADAVQRDPTRLALALDYCTSCGRAVADLLAIFGDYDENNPKLAGAQHVQDGFDGTCDNCWSDPLFD
jgi:hypothetical protein